jgi:hypothetical protein
MPMLRILSSSVADTVNLHGTAGARSPCPARLAMIRMGQHMRQLGGFCKPVAGGDKASKDVFF